MTSSGSSPKKRRYVIFFTCLLLLGLYAGVNSTRHGEPEKDFRSRFRRAVIRWFPDEAAEVVKSYGLHYTNPNNVRPANAVDKTIVLIHGLDDPGKVWMNLSPALIAENFDAWTMVYPNDQPLMASARFFSDQLMILRRLGAKRITIVAHSMGGLVAREMLTNPGIGYHREVQAGRLPQVDQLIMVATPNHGSHLAQFRVLENFENSWST